MNYTILGHKENPLPANRQLSLDVLVGLSENPKKLPSHLFYDDEGSRLFECITDSSAYYLPQCELEIFTTKGRELLSGLAGRSLNVVDLGAGDGHKTAVLLEHLAALQAEVRYVPIDISEGAMRTVTSMARSQFPQLKVAGLVGEYFEGIRWLSHESHRRNLVLFLGSNIGNFNKAQARGFLRQLWMALSDGDMVLIGFDLKKDIATLLNAYNDAEGFTNAFNLNLLTRMNRELGADFEPSRFRHYGTYNALTGAMESFLISQQKQTVHIPALQTSFEFDAWEPIHTEYSYKYLISDLADLACHSGFTPILRFTDEREWFCSSLWKTEKHGNALPIG